LLSAASTLSIAEDQNSTNQNATDQSATDQTRHRMGDEGKLPATGAASSRVPDQGAGTGTSTGTEGSHRMGDEGKLPATNSVTTRVPEMNKAAPEAGK
jgi:hypothetical protein